MFSNLSEVVDNPSGVDVDEDHGDWGDDGKDVEQVPVDHQAVKRSSLLGVGIWGVENGLLTNFKAQFPSQILPLGRQWTLQWRLQRSWWTMLGGRWQWCAQCLSPRGPAYDRIVLKPVCQTEWTLDSIVLSPVSEEVLDKSKPDPLLNQPSSMTSLPFWTVDAFTSHTFGHQQQNLFSYASSSTCSVYTLPLSVSH